MRGQVTIDDLKRFVADPQHVGKLIGSVSFPPLETGELTAKRGTFRLFAPTDRPGLKLMVYQLVLADGDTEYFFDGYKEVHSRSPVFLWKDTTTLYTRLYEGQEQTGRVIAAGVLTLSLWQLLGMLPTFRAERVGALGGFASFFATELWHSYVTRSESRPTPKTGVD